jgi:hypothetical protein
MSTKKKNKPAQNECPEFKSAEEFELLSAADKEKVWNYYNRVIPESEMRPLTKRERARFEKIQRRSVGRPKVGQGAKVVAVTLEKGLLQRVDDYARQHEMKRAEMITKGLLLVIGQRA